MRNHAHERHDPLTCAGLTLNQEKLNAEYNDALQDLLHLLSHLFGCVHVQAARGEGLEAHLKVSLHAFAQGIAGVISGAYVTEALARSHEATGNMYAALAAGARVAHKTTCTEEAAGVVHAFATMAACEGRPEILALDTAEDPAPPSE